MMAQGIDREMHRAWASRVIPAPPQAIFDVLADPAMHPRIDGGGTVQRALPGVPERLHPGARFAMSMRWGSAYRIRNTVVEWDEPYLIAWRHWGGHRWRYELRIGEGGTEVVETFDWSTSLQPFFIEKVGFPQRNLPGMVATLERLDRVVTGIRPV
jgi:hypothetical protein